MLYATQLSTPAQLSHQPDVYPPASRPADDNNEKNSLEAIQAGDVQTHQNDTAKKIRQYTSIAEKSWRAHPLSTKDSLRVNSLHVACTYLWIDN